MAEIYCLENIKSGISKYKDEIVPLIKDGYYGMAGIELQSIILILNFSINEMERGEFCSKIFALSARLELLSKACSDEHNTGDNKKVVEYGLNLVNEQIPEIEKYLKSCVNK